MVVMTIANDRKKLKYICIALIFGCGILWITVYKPSFEFESKYFASGNNIQGGEYIMAANDEYDLADSIVELPIDNENVQQQVLCTPDTFNQGKWIYDPLVVESPNNTESWAKAAGYHCKHKFNHFRFRDAGDKGKKARKIMDYRWQPDNCKLLPMKTEQLADHLIKHPLLFVGDSITQLQYESLYCLLGNHFPNRHRANSTKDTSAIKFIRSDYLLRLSDYKLTAPFEETGPQIGKGENKPWVHALANFDYLVINTAAHWHPNLLWGPNQDEAELLAAFKKAAKVVLDYLVENVQPHQRVWIRTSPYGHAKCSQFTKPQTNPLVPTGMPGEYEWHLFAEFDLIWKQLISDLPKKEGGKKDPRFDILEIAPLSNLRGDAHSRPDSDCLHTCLPGPVDEWNRLLYHEILKKLTV